MATEVIENGTVGPTKIHVPGNVLAFGGKGWVAGRRLSVQVTAVTTSCTQSFATIVTVKADGTFEAIFERPKDFPIHISFGATAYVSYARFEEPTSGGVSKDLLQCKFTE